MKVVELDAKIFKGKKPRDWHNVVKDYVYNNLSGKTIIIHNKDGSVEEICFARTNEKVKKEFSKNPHKVIDELARKQNNNIRNLSIINIEKILQSSVCFGENYLHSHQWLDENGWKFRIAYVKYNETIWEITLNISKTKDKRNILCDINQIKKVEQTDGSSVKGHSQRSTFSDKNIP